MSGTVLHRGAVVERPHRALGVVEGHAGLDGGLGLLKHLKVGLPHALFLEQVKEAFNHPVLLRRVRRDELLAQPVLLGARLEMLGGEHLAVVTTQMGALFSARINQPIPRQAGLLQRLLRFLRSSSMAHAQADELSIVAVDHRYDSDPTILLRMGTRHID